MMTEAEFDALYGDTLLRIEEAIEASGADLDYETVNDILTLTCADGSVIILSRQTAARQLWLAARSGGFHFNYDESRRDWRCTTTGDTLTGMLKAICLEQGGVELGDF